MANFTFPDLNSTKILPFKLLRSAVTENPAVLDDQSCPYSDDVKDFLRLIFVAKSATVAGIPKMTLDDGDLPDWGDGSEEFDAVDVKIKTLLHRLDRIAGSVNLNDTTEQIQISKAQAQLYDRLLAMRERATNLKTMVQFQEVMLDMVERHLSPDQRTAVMTEIRERLGL